MSREFNADVTPLQPQCRKLDGMGMMSTADDGERIAAGTGEGAAPADCRTSPVRILDAIPNRSTLATNLIIGGAVAFFVYFIKQTAFLEQSLAYLISLLFAAQITLFSNKVHYAPSFVGMAVDGAALTAATLAWTYVRGSAARILSLIGLAAVTGGVTLILFRFAGVLVSSLLIVTGIAFMAVLEGAADLFARRFRTRILEEKQDAEFSIIRHLTHNVKPNIQIARSPITEVSDFLAQRGMLGEVMGLRLDGSPETVEDALRNAQLSLDQINDILDATRRLVTHEIRRDEFTPVDLRDLFTREIVERFGNVLNIRLQCPAGLRARIHRQSFVEAVNNLVRNARTHGFPDGTAGAELVFVITETRRRIVIDYTNNGRPFPVNLTARDFLSFGGRSADSPGEGLGGAWIGKVVAAHGGTFEIIRDDHPAHFRITIPK